MTSKTHIAFSVLCLTIVYQFVCFDFSSYLCTAVCFSVLPDIDTEKSWAAQSIPYIDDFLRFISKNQKKWKFFKHRNKITHSILVPVLLFFLAYKNLDYIYCYFYLSAGIGWLSHVVLDFVAEKIIRIKCNTKQEDIVFNIFWIISIVLNFKILK
jgi:membrane-bound metal-dependent hydrolase YbcI (DUF457 family)